MTVSIMRQNNDSNDMNGRSVVYRDNKLSTFKDDRWGRPSIIIDKNFNWNYNLLKPFGKNLWTAQVSKCEIIVSDMDDSTRFLNGGKKVLKVCYSDQEVLDFFLNEQKLILSEYNNISKYWKVPVSSAFNNGYSVGKHDLQSWMQLHCQVVYNINDIVPGSVKCLGKIPFSGFIGFTFKRLLGGNNSVKIVANTDPSVNINAMKSRIKFNNTIVRPIKTISTVSALGVGAAYMYDTKYGNKEAQAETIEEPQTITNNNISENSNSNFKKYATNFINKTYGIITSGMIPKTSIQVIDSFEESTRNNFDINKLNMSSDLTVEELNIICSSIIQSISKISDQRYSLLDQLSIDESNVQESSNYNNYIIKVNEQEFLLAELIKEYVSQSSSLVSNNNLVSPISTNVSKLNKDAVFEFISNPKNIVGITLIGFLAIGTFFIIKNFKKIKQKIYDFFND